MARAGGRAVSILRAEARFFTTGDPLRFQEQLRRLIGRDGPIERLRWDPPERSLTPEG